MSPTRSSSFRAIESGLSSTTLTAACSLGFLEEGVVPGIVHLKQTHAMAERVGHVRHSAIGTFLDFSIERGTCPESESKCGLEIVDAGRPVE